MKRFLAVFLFLAAGCGTLVPRPSEPVRVIVVATTDVHGWFNGRTEVPRAGGEGIHYGGLALLSSYVSALREENDGRVILVDSGDIFQGTLESNLFEGEAMVQGYNALGYSAAAVGNHEFDFGPLGPDAVARTPNSDPLGALKRNAVLAKFPFLAANMTEKKNGRTPSWASRYTIVRAGAARIGIIGLATPDTPNVTMAANVESLDFGDPIPATVQAAAELRRKGVDAILLIAHIGGRCTNMEEPHSLESCDRQQHAMQLLEGLPAGTVDAYFGGHTHAQMRQFVNGIPAVQALAYSREFATVELFVDTANDRVLQEKTVLRPHTMLCSFVWDGTTACDPRDKTPQSKLVRREFQGRTIEPDVRVASVLNPYLRRVAAKRNERLGITSAARFTRNYAAESPLGNLIADVLREATAADFAMMNSGGIRAELREGELLYSDFFEVSPFDNYPAVVTMSGKDIAEILRLTVTGERGILQVSGLKYTFDAAKDSDKPAAERHRILTVTLPNGEPLDPEKMYRVVMPDFLAAGGDGTATLMKALPAGRIEVDQSQPIREVLIQTLQKRRAPLFPTTEGRITVVNPPPPS